jgi:hypothetical protein
MTVDFASPRSSLIASGSQTKFTFTWPVLEEPDLLVYLDDVLQIEFSDYIIEPDFEDGGDVVFTLAPISGVVVRLQRKTSITQQLDYTASPFPSQTHEVQLDKIIMILQELLLDDTGGAATFDLSAQQEATLVNILNSGGSDAVIPSWVDASLAGVFHGEVTDAAPADGSATAKPDGYIWIEI